MRRPIPTESESRDASNFLRDGRNRSQVSVAPCLFADQRSAGGAPRKHADLPPRLGLETAATAISPNEKSPNCFKSCLDSDWTSSLVMSACTAASLRSGLSIGNSQSLLSSAAHVPEHRRHDGAGMVDIP